MCHLSWVLKETVKPQVEQTWWRQGLGGMGKVLRQSTFTHAKVLK